MMIVIETVAIVVVISIVSWLIIGGIATTIAININFELIGVFVVMRGFVLCSFIR